MSVLNTTTFEMPNPSEDAPIAVFLHGLYGQGKNFATVAKALTDVATTVLVDLPHHGRSGWGFTFDYFDVADVVATQIETTNVSGRPLVLIGHSMGGKVAMLVALYYPQLIDKLAVIDISPSASGGAAKYRFYADQVLGLDLASISRRQDADAALAAAIPSDQVRSFLLQNLHRDTHAETGWRWLANFEVLRHDMDVIDGWPDDAANYCYNGPTLWLGGTRSDAVSQDRLPAMRKLFPKAELEMIEGAGHWVQADAPEQVIAILRSFISS